MSVITHRCRLQQAEVGAVLSFGLNFHKLGKFPQDAYIFLQVGKKPMKSTISLGASIFLLVNSVPVKFSSLLTP